MVIYWKWYLSDWLMIDWLIPSKANLTSFTIRDVVLTLFESIHFLLFQTVVFFFRNKEAFTLQKKLLFKVFPSLLPITEKMSCRQEQNWNLQNIMDTWSYEDGQLLHFLEGVGGGGLENFDFVLKILNHNTDLWS